MLDLYCVTDSERLNPEDLFGRGFYDRPDLFFNICVMGKNIYYRSMPEFKVQSIYEIDARPEMIDMTEKSIADLQIFKTLVKPDNALIIDPERIGDLLAQLVEAQSPKQAEIRERIRKSDARDNLKQTLHAQILSVDA
jgi:hypothetical protein